MTGTAVVSKVRLRTWLEWYKKYQPKWKKWTEESVLRWGKGEEWTTKSLDTIENHRGEITLENNIHLGKWNIDHVVTYAGGKIIMLDSSHWNGDIEPHFHDIKKRIEKETKVLKQYHLHPEYAGILYSGHKIEWGYEKIEHGLYLVNPNALWAFIKEYAEK